MILRNERQSSKEFSVAWNKEISSQEGTDLRGTVVYLI